MIRRPPRSTRVRSSAASDVYKRQQVVAVKRGTEDIVQDLLRTKQIMQSIVVNAQKQANDSLNNIQLDQPQDDNTIPVAPQLDDMPDEQTIITKPVTPNVYKPIQLFIERPDPTLTKTIVPEKKISQPIEKPFWLKPASDKPCLLYTSDAADDLTRVDLGGRRI